MAFVTKQTPLDRLRKGRFQFRADEQSVELVGVFDRLLQQWDDTKLIKLETGETIKVDDPANELNPDNTYRFHGVWHEHPKYGKQFKAQSFAGDSPITQRGVIHYLVDQCDWVGKATAQKLWDKFGASAIEVLRDTPEKVAEAGILTLTQANEASVCLKYGSDIQKTKIDLIGLFKGYGFREKAIQDCLALWGAQSPQVVRRDPFKMMIAGVSGAGYKRCDRLYTGLGLPMHRLKRQMLKAWYDLQNDPNGHTWFSRMQLSGINARAIELGIRSKWFVTKTDDHGAEWITIKRKAIAEESVASHLKRLASWRPPMGDTRRTKWPAVELLEGVTDHQREQAGKAMSSPVAVLAGSPGTGKTFVAGAVIRKIVGASNIYACAPTGKAAVRLAESIYKATGIKIQAKTIHSTLGLMGDPDDYAISQLNSLEGYVIVDETSMVDVPLMAMLLGCCRTGTHILFLGDPYQLPPVGHGAPLRDMLESKHVTTGELTEIQRNAGQIVRACKSIKEGEEFAVSEKYTKGTGDNLRFIEAVDAADIVGGVLRMHEIVPRYEFDPVWDTQVLVAVNTKGPCARVVLNKRLQDKLNPNGATVPGHPFRVDDKIICLKNSKCKRVVMKTNTINFPLVDRPESYLDIQDEVFVANGELGKVIAVGPNQTIARFDNPERLVRILHGKPKPEKKVVEGDSKENGEGAVKEDEKEEAATVFDLGYAITTHKCVSPDTIVETEEGLLPICDIAKSGVIASIAGPAEYSNLVSYGHTHCQKITTEHGHEITVSDDHKCEVWNGSNWVLKRAVEIKQGMWVRQRLGATVEPGSVVTLPQTSAGPKAEQVVLPAILGVAVAEFFGLMVADGTIFRGGIRLVKAQYETVERFSTLASLIFGIPKHEPTHTPGKGSGWWTCEIHSQHIAQWLTLIGGMSPNAKSVPRCVLRSHSRIQAFFLRGLFEDGSVHTKNGKLDHINWTTVYSHLAQYVRVMLLRLGIVASTNSQRKRQNSIYIYSSDAARFGEVIGFISKEKQRRAKLPAWGSGESTRQRVPVSIALVKSGGAKLRRSIGKSNYSNAVQRGYISRATAEKFGDAILGDSDFANWHYSRITTVTPCTSPVMCVKVPSQGRFLQNGFPWSNSQGSEAKCVIVVIDPMGRSVCSREHVYTSISRAKELCVMIGKRAVCDSFCRNVALGKRKTFLVELLAKG